MILNDDHILRTIHHKELDVRKTHDGRWIDQKCTPDVVCAVADIVDSISEGKGYNFSFNSKDVWFSDYAYEYVIQQFNKSNPKSKSSVAEYNKFYQQPLNLLAYAGVLKRTKQGRTNVYTIIDSDMLQYIGMADRNALHFLQIYITEVLRYSNLSEPFENFFEEQTDESFQSLKTSFSDFCHKYTNIKRTYEPNRIFSKVLNPLAQKRHKKGARHGRLSKDVITYTDLMYNTKNFRDIFAHKPKGVSRQDWLKQHPASKSVLAKFRADSAKAKKYVRRFNDKYFDGQSELQDSMAVGSATQMHHIFPQHNFREISGYVENIIALTPSQHFSEAHPNNHTQEIDPEMQELLLKAKAHTIEYVTTHPQMEQIYSFDNFAHVLKVGFDISKPESEYNDFDSALNEITAHYRID